MTCLSGIDCNVVSCVDWQTGEFSWDSHEQGAILASFYDGYAITQLVSGCVSLRLFSGRCLLLGGSLVTCVMTLVTPVVTQFGDIAAFVVARVVAGIGQVMRVLVTQRNLSNNDNNNNTSSHRVSRDLEPTSSGINAGAGQTNDSRHCMETPGRRLTCSSGCQWFFNGVMRSPSTALSPPSKRRCGLACLLFNILYPREFSTEGLKNNNNNNRFVLGR